MSDQSQDSKASNARKANASTVIVVSACKQQQVLMLLLCGAPVNLHSCHQSRECDRSVEDLHPLFNLLESESSI